MQELPGKTDRFRFDAGALNLAEVQRLADDMWSDLAFDDSAKAKLRRDGLTLDDVRLTGPNPFALRRTEDGQTEVAALDHAHAETLIDLWRVHFMKGLRPGSLAA